MDWIQHRGAMMSNWMSIVNVRNCADARCRLRECIRNSSHCLSSCRPHADCALAMPSQGRPYVRSEEVFIILQGFVAFDPLPLTVNPPPLVMDSCQVNMFALDKGDFTLSADLPDACRTLYQNVAQVRSVCNHTNCVHVQSAQIIWLIALYYQGIHCGRRPVDS